jgi:pimeloyl-ACP methyl ester carboxylesterase
MSRIGTLARQTTSRFVMLPPVPDLPPGRLVELPGRGRTYVTDTGPPAEHPDAPTVFLLHALACTGLLTWYPSLDALRARYRVVLFDQRWHGQGIRTVRFSLADCADDVAAVADALDIDTFVAAGYSMGSLVAPLAWRRHPDRVRGLVLCASATHFAETPRRQQSVRAVSLRLAGLAERQRDALVAELDQAAPDARLASVAEVDDDWAWRQFRATSGRAVTSAAAVIARFDSRDWIGTVAVPTAVVVTRRDRLIPPERQRSLARLIPGATVHEADAGHASCVLNSAAFRPALLAACASVTSRLEPR